MAVEVLFLGTRDTLELLGIQNEKYYSFYSQNLKDVIDNNKKLRISIHVQDLRTAEEEKKEFVLTRKKRTYPTGTFPHA